MTKRKQPALFKPETAIRVEHALRLWNDGWKHTHICRAVHISNKTLLKAIKAQPHRAKAAAPAVVHTPNPSRSTLVRTLGEVEAEGVPWPTLAMLVAWERLLRIKTLNR